MRGMDSVKITVRPVEDPGLAFGRALGGRGSNTYRVELAGEVAEAWSLRDALELLKLKLECSLLAAKLRPAFEFGSTADVGIQGPENAHRAPGVPASSPKA